MKKLITILLIFNLQLLISNCQAQSPVDSVASGCALDFTGINGHLKLAGYNFGTANFSIEVWVKVGTSAIGSSRTIVMNGYQGLPIRALAINASAEPYLFFRDVSGNQLFAVATGIAINDNKWHHLAATRNATVGTLYMDGVVIASISNTSISNINTTCSFTWVGATNTTSFACPSNENESRFLGNIDELRFWSKALTQIEIQQNMCQKLIGTEIGLVGYWRFDDCGGLTTIDSSGGGNNGTLN